MVGDKKGGGSTQALARSKALIDRLRRTVGVPLRFVHVVRNPYDYITTHAQRKGLALKASVEEYFALLATNDGVRRVLDTGEVAFVRLESVVADPRGSCGRLCDFLGVTAGEDYLKACAGIVRPSWGRTRHRERWSAEPVETARERMVEYDFLRGYTWDT